MGRRPTRPASLERPAVRIGRPRRELAGEVDNRILDAARRVFLERGLAGASMDEIASLARAGKPTIYARFENKEALFAAVVRRNVDKLARVEGFVPSGATIEERLKSAAATLLNWVLIGDTVGLMRLGISEARRFSDLAFRVHSMARQRTEEVVARILGEIAQTDTLGELPAFAPEQIAATTKLFVDLTFMPMILKALFGERLELLRAEIEPHADRSVAFFLAACRRGDPAGLRQQP